MGLPPEVGSRLELSLTIRDAALHLRGDVVRQQEHGARWLLSLSLRDVREADADVLRRTVFAALRAERAAEAG